MGVPVRLRDFNQFVEHFGDDMGYGELGVQMRQFFTAGGSDAIVVRAANGAVPSDITLANEAGVDVLTLRALDAGVSGDQIRAVVDYATPDPELTFNLTVYRETIDAQGRLGRVAEERYPSLTMDRNAPNYIEIQVNGVSKLVTAIVDDDPGGTVTPPLNVDNSATLFSQSGIYFADADAFLTAFAALTDPTIMVEIDGSGLAIANLGPAIVAGDPTATLTGIAAQINAVLGQQNLSARVGARLEGNATGVALRIAVTSIDGTRSIRILPALANDATGALALGAARGGVEVAVYSGFRPQISGFHTRPFPAPGDFATIEGLLAPAPAPYTINFTDGTAAGTTAALAWGTAGAAALLDDGDPATPLSLNGLRINLDGLVAALNATVGTAWRFARHGLRISGQRTDGAVGPARAAAVSAIPAVVTNYFNGAVATRPSAALGQDGGVFGDNGSAPLLEHYETIFRIISREVDIFNMMILPRGHNQTDAARSMVWGAASSFCRDQNALLIIDPRSDNGTWSNVDAVVADAADFKTGILPEVSCTFWPRVRTAVGAREMHVDPCGTLAGVIASTVGRSGVWRAAAGLSAPLTGTTGLEYPMSEADNGVINPRAINALRAKSTGVVCWGARTLAGDDAFSNRDYAYINVRMTTDFIKNSVSRALEGFLFQNNNPTTWANIELMVKSFMQGLYQKGAFRGTTAEAAYDVQCNAFTTSLADIQLGVLNVWVMFAPNFPTEFIHLHIKHKFQQPSA